MNLMRDKVDVLIIGAGSAGISALRQVQKSTDRYLVVDPGPLGTTCARVGCMPSKVLINVAREFNRRTEFKNWGIRGGEALTSSLPEVLAHVRKLRDDFSQGMERVTLKLAGEKLLRGKASFISPTRVKVENKTYEAERIVIAAGSQPMIPRSWAPFQDRILTSSTLFEQADLPGKIGVVGLGAIGLELGQALCRLGVEIAGFDMSDFIGGITDPAVNASAVEIFGREFDLYLGKPVDIQPEGSGLVVRSGDSELYVDRVIASMGVRPNTEGLGLENLGLELDARGLPPFDPRTMQVGDLPVFICGDVNGCRPILHEALDEGFIAGSNATTREDPECYCRRTQLRIVFTDPSIVAVGPSRSSFSQEDSVSGSADFSNQSRALIEGRNLGILNIYAERASGKLLGSEMIVPEGEHLGHLLSLGIQKELTVADLLEIPFYHPTVEEGLRTALLAAAGKTALKTKKLSVCESCPESPVC